MKWILISLLITALVVVSPVSYAEEVPAIVGTWKWSSGQEITINDDFTAIAEKDGVKAPGTWRKLSDEMFIVSWLGGKYEETVEVDGDKLKGTNKDGEKITAEKLISKPATSEGFAVGSKFTGKRKIQKHRKLQNWSLAIDHIEGIKFTGRIVLKGGKDVELLVKGTFPKDGNGFIDFETVSDLMLQKFEGTLKNGRIDCEFSGRARDGRQIKGTAFLAPR